MSERTADGLAATVWRWNARTGREDSRMRLDDYVRDLEFSPDARTLAIGTWRGAVMLWGNMERVPREIAPPEKSALLPDISIASVA
ncbi:hypothetical protein, partial [Agromyces sp. NPDC055658]